MRSSLPFRIVAPLFALAVLVSACGSSVKPTAISQKQSRIVVQSFEKSLSGGYSLTAVVIDRNTGTSLPAAHLSVVNGATTSRCAKTGAVQMNAVPAGLYRISCSYPGYKSANRVVEVDSDKTTVLKIELVASN